jgi:hypothetical protein
VAAPLPTADSHAALPTFADAKCWHCRSCRSRPAVSYAKPLAVIEMKHTILLLIIFGLLNCQNSRKQFKTTTIDCDNTKLVDYVYPIDKFINEKTFVYSLKSNREETKEIIRKTYNLRVEKDTLLTSISKNAQNITNDSTIFALKNGIPKIIKSFTKVEAHPDLIETKETISENRFCEFATFEDSSEYDVPTENGNMNWRFNGFTTHKKYVTKVFNGKEYNCAIFESEKTLTVELNGNKQQLKGTWKGCGCEGIGELYSTTKTEDGLVIEHQLEEIIENE